MKHKIIYYKVTTPSGKKWREPLNKKQIKNLRTAEFKVKRCKR